MAFHMGDPTGNGGDSECVLGNFPSPGSPVTTLPANFTSFLCCYYSFQRKYKCNAFSLERVRHYPAEGTNKDGDYSYTKENLPKVMFPAKVLLGGQMIGRLAFTSDPCRVEVTGTLSTGGPLGYLSNMMEVTFDPCPGHGRVNSAADLCMLEAHGTLSRVVSKVFLDIVHDL